MNVNGVSTNLSGFDELGSEAVTQSQITRVRPRADNNVDLGSSTKRFKTLFYETLNPVPGGGSGGPFLPLDGSSPMTNNFPAGGHELQNVSAIRGSTTNVIIGNTAATSSLHNVVIGDTAVIAVSSDNTVLIGYGGSATSQLGVVVGTGASSLGNDTIVVGRSSAAGSGVANTIVGAVSSITGTAASSVVVGNGSTLANGTTVVIGPGCTSSALRAHCFGSSLANSQTNTILLDASANLRTNSTGSCDIGTTAARFKDVYASGNLIGATKTSAVDNIITNISTGVVGNLPAFTSDKVIADSNVVAGNVCQNISTGAVGNLPSFTSDKVITDSGIHAADVVINTTHASTIDHIVTYANTSGILIKDSSHSLSEYAQLTGATYSGTVIGTTLKLSTPICYAANRSASLGVSFTTTVAQLVALTSWTETIDPANLFTLTTTTGLLTYTGVTTLYFRCKMCINFSFNGASDSALHWISKNGSTTGVQPWTISQNGTNALNAVNPVVVESIQQLATNDTLQLIGNLTFAGDSHLTYVNCDWLITQC
jgi:hypothetical protein